MNIVLKPTADISSEKRGNGEPLREDDLSVNTWPNAADEDLESAIDELEDGPSIAQPKSDAEKALSVHSNVLARTVSGTSRRSRADPGPPPDGGLVAWSQVALLHLTIFSTFGYITAFGSFQTYYQAILGVSTSKISWIGSVQLFLLFFIGTFSGRALDAGLFRPVYTAGAILQILGIFTTSVATEYWQLLLAQGFCMGIASGLQFCPSMGLCATYFVRRRALVLGVGALGSCTGGVLFPILVQQLLPRIGFGWTVRIVGFIMVLVNAITVAFYRTRLPPRKTGPIVEWAAFREAPYTLYCIASFLFFWGLYFAFFYVGSYSRDRLGMSYQASVNLLLAMVCTGFIFRLLPNFLADKLGPVNLILPFTFVCGIMMFAWIGVDSPGTLYVFALLYGPGAAGIQSMYPATLASLTSDMSKAGVRMGMSFTVVSFASLTGPPLAGALIQYHGGNYLYAQTWAGTSFLAAGIVLIAARVAKVGWRVRCRI
ncbi:hypothetical protein BAUCODRAFT_70871 [Baudoinia panamericana UAMH 10762]|uniref:Major facilitator superfamily (MFS) profile domain-containing protein n=1 Tax=Baudoinia panamericana (strain UAMH 10762) TaxID=717646 RepID=M2LMR3_BAUPA|nr:uncharacterized protein BAUCODRAFT_70871 [Baudoinia panamericana UAMH 10762]EMC95617.1 hypothetical protein BAUCODRAFT_70871 [Baudoinia panamericana UAMH 10762]